MEVVSGQGGAYGIKKDRSAWAWGHNRDGAAGIGRKQPNDLVVPTKLATTKKVLHIARGVEHGCAVLDDGGKGTVHCWGGNGYGRVLGYASGPVLKPTAVNGIPVATQVSVGKVHSCALLGDQTVRCWGNSTQGALGNGSSDFNAAGIVTAKGLSKVTAIATSETTNCALKSDKSLWCWGNNDYGQQGNNSKKGTAVPVKIPTSLQFANIDVGFRHTCGRTAPGAVYCWGDGGSGAYINRLGNGSNTPSLVPSLVKGVSAAVSLAVGDYHTCAVLKGQSARCWGADAWAQLGNGSHYTAAAAQPVTFKGVSEGIDGAAAHGDTTCVLSKKDSTIRCVGGGVLGPPTGYTYHATPVKVAGP